MHNRLVHLICTSFFIITISNSAMAFGIGAYLDGGIGEARLKEYYTNVSGLYSYSRYYKGLNYFFGGGLLLDTCVVDDSLFNYRLHIGCNDYVSPHGPSSWVVQGFRFHYTMKHTVRLSLTNTFGFGILRKKSVRLWIGPSISAHYYPIEKRSHLLVPGLTLGANFHLNDFIFLTAEGGVKYEWSAPKSRQDYAASVNCHINLGVLFRIKDAPGKTKTYIRDKSIPDNIPH